MIAAWMLYCLAVGLAFVVVGHALERGLHLAGGPARAAWVLAVAGSLFVPMAALVRPEAFSTVSLPRPASAVGLAPGTAGPGVTSIARIQRTPSPQSWSLGDLDPVLAWGWGFSSAALLLGLGAAAIRLSALKRRWRREVLDGRPVLVSENVGPAVAGLWQPAVVVPSWALQLSEGERRLMLAHEAEHVRAGDPWLLCLGRAALILAPWNAALWWQVRRLRLAVEIDCDARVLRQSGTASEYGELLLRVGGLRGGLPLGVPGLGEPASFLEHRIRRMVTVLPRWRWAGTAAALVVAAAALVTACETPRPVETPVPPQQTTDDALILRPGVSSEDVRPLLSRYFGPDPSRLADSSVTVWFVVDQRGTVVSKGTVPRRLRDTDLNTQSALRLIPGHDTLHIQAVLVDAERGLPPTLVVRLGDGRFRSPAGATDGSAGAGLAPHVQGQPVLLSRPSLVYPPLLEHAGIQGSVLVEAVVDTTGQVVPPSVKVLRSSHPGFEASARDVVERSLYRPGRASGRAVQVRIQVPVDFTLQQQAVWFPNPEIRARAARADTIRNLARQLHPEAFGSANAGSAIALVFDAQRRVVAHAAGTLAPGTSNCEDVVRQLLPKVTARFTAGGCADYGRNSGVTVYWGTLPPP